MAWGGVNHDFIRCPKGDGYMARIQGEFWARKMYSVSFTYR